MSFQITAGSGTTISADVAGGEQIQEVKLIDPTTGSSSPIGVAANPMSVTVSNFPATQPVSGPVTDAQLRASAVPVSGAFFPATQPVSGTVSVGNFPATQPVSGTVAVSNFPATQPVSGTFFQATQPVSIATPQLQQPATLSVTATGAAAAGVTLTLPAVAGQFHHLCSVEITAYSSSARTGGATPVLVTTTNLPGNPAFTFGSAAAIGTTDRYIPSLAAPLRSTTVNTATTIVCPGTTGIIWRLNASYYTAP